MENQLINIKVENDQQLVSARDLYRALEVKRRFSAWKEQNFKDFEEGADFTTVLSGTLVPLSAKRELQTTTYKFHRLKED